ncbi:FMN-dependent NADH-azoreductase [Olivibacter domesticus]|uniref:FMN dependent NADH:quinone oxidoreductase n=1 Tax=Olivibacter domesticus TaxID=407022 RepID=A0A1H7W315_OLID1|nr:NAD(P)H-dependent oxidoreductase [Olivibacter domesticus]SEM15982.1 FMN-dependent NADH-azoreductase [Olivibacter domesticus]
MKKILQIISSVNGNQSFSLKLSNTILERLLSIYPGSTVQMRDLAKNPLPHLEDTHFTAFYKPSESLTEDDRSALLPSDEAIKEVQEAEIIVIGVPLYNFGIPSTLKAWVDHITRAGLTFRYNENGPEGLLINKKVYLAISSGGVYSEGPLKGYDFVEPYLKTILGFIGLTDIIVFRIEGTLVAEIKDAAWPKTAESVEAYAF